MRLAANFGRPWIWVTKSDGTTRNVIIEEPFQSHAIDGPWKKANQDGKGFSIRHEASFELTKNFGEDQRVTLDLGKVDVMAKVTLNGNTFDTLWRTPYTLDVTDALKPGPNQLEVLVTSTTKGKPSMGDAVLRTSKRVVVE